MVFLTLLKEDKKEILLFFVIKKTWSAKFGAQLV